MKFILRRRVEANGEYTISATFSSETRTWTFDHGVDSLTVSWPKGYKVSLANCADMALQDRFPGKEIALLGKVVTRGGA